MDFLLLLLLKESLFWLCVEDCEQFEYEVANCFIFCFSVLFSFTVFTGVYDVELKRKLKESLFHTVGNEDFTFHCDGELLTKKTQTKIICGRELKVLTAEKSVCLNHNTHMAAGSRRLRNKVIICFFKTRICTS